MSQPNRLKVKASLIIVVTFALGAITGAALNGIYLQAGSNARGERGPFPALMLDGLRRELHLTDAQAAQILMAAADTRRELRDVRLEQCPGLPDARQRLIGRVRALLTVEQQQRFDTIMGRRQMRGAFPGRDGR